MSIEEIRGLKHAQPFVPFEIVTDSGRTVRIDHAPGLALSPSGNTIAGFATDGFFYVRLPQIADVKVLGSRPDHA